MEQQEEKVREVNQGLDSWLDSWLDCGGLQGGKGCGALIGVRSK